MGTILVPLFAHYRPAAPPVPGGLHRRLTIEGSSYRLREHADLLPDTVRFKPNATTNPTPPTLKRRGRPPKNGGADYVNG